MKRRSITLSLMLAAAPLSAAVPPQERPLYRPGEVLVRYVPEARSKALDLRVGYGLQLRRQVGDGVELVQAPAFTTVTQLLDVLRADPRIAVAEPNFILHPAATIPDDPLFDLQWGLRNTGQANFVPDGPGGITGADLHLPEAWDSDGDGASDRIGSAAVIVAVIDDAIDTTHPELAPNVVTPRDVVSDDNDPRPAQADEVHGTWVTGCVGAVGNNGAGIAAPVWRSRLMPIRFGFDTASEIEALAWARDHGARIVNASFGGPSFSQQELNAIGSLAADDILFVVAAGNDDANLDRAVASYPANYDAANIVTVAATNRQDGIASFSSYGPVAADVAAPGLQIVTTAVGGGYSQPVRCGQADGSCGVSGTSFSSPYVAGVAALLRGALPSAGFRELKARLVEGADPGLEPGNPVRRRVAGGRVNAARALSLTPRPSLVIRSVTPVDSDGNHRLDPGETLDLDIVVHNQWQDATNVVARLGAQDDAVAVNTGPVTLGALPADGNATVRFSVTVPAQTPRPYQEVFFDLALAADGGYAATRSFALEVAELQLDQPVSEHLQSDLYDEFHTYQLDLGSVSPGMDLAFDTTSPNDIDILVKRGAPPKYQITLNAPPSDDDAVFYTDADFIGGAKDGKEHVVVPDPRPGTYYVTVVNFAQVENNPYTLQARQVSASPAPRSGGGGALAPGLLLVLLSLAAARARRP